MFIVSRKPSGNSSNRVSDTPVQALPAIEGGVPERSSFLVFGAPRIDEAEIQEVVSTLRSGWIGTGPKTARFEEAFRAYKKSTYAIAVNSCTAALHLSMLALGIQPGDEVISTPMTFCATINAILHSRAVPVFADCDPVTMTIDPKEIEKKITPRTRAILVVHFAGRPCDMDAIMAIATRHHLRVIEDCAHAIETEYHDRPAGTIGDAGCFSFYVTKNIVTAEGGMVLTRDHALEERIKVLALHGMSRDAWKRFSDSGYKHYEIVDAGFKYNMTDIQASLGLHQLRRVDEMWERRRAIWARYSEAFRDLPCAVPPAPETGTRHAHHLFTLMIDPVHLRMSRDHLLDAIQKEGVGVGIHYLSLVTHAFYRRFIAPGDSFPAAQSISERTLSLPLSAHLSDADVDSVIRAVTKVLRYYSS
jgi:dTDP-4-amino-4,6-dideoxygalactose transaminase